MSASCNSLNDTNTEFDNSFERQVKWLNFIRNNDLFMLKSPKGDVWIISLSESGANRNYDTVGNEIFTQISYDWEEIYDIKDCIIHNINE